MSTPTTHSETPAQHVDPFHGGDRIRKARERLGMDRQRFAEHIGVHRETLAKYEETGKAKRSTLISVAWATGVRLEWLQSGELPWLNEKGPASEETGPDVHPLGLEPRTHWVSVQGGAGDRPRGRGKKNSGPRGRSK